MCAYFFFLLQDQDKLRPLSSLANLAISLSDIQDMDPIFTNLPYSTNVEEEAPLVSVYTSTNSELGASKISFRSHQFYIFFFNFQSDFGFQMADLGLF